MKFLSLIVPVFLACGLPDEAKAQAQAQAADAKWTADFKLSLIEKEGKWVFVIDGRTNIPQDTRLRARIYALEIFGDFKEGEREDDEPLVWEDDSGQPSYRAFVPVAGRFREEVYSFVRKPYSIRYRAKIHYVARDQTDAMMLKVGDDDFFRKADLRVGTDADYAKELEERVKDVADDLTAAEKLYGELADAYAERRKDRKVDAWKVWREPWYSRVEMLSKRNEQRYSLWAVWMERQAKMRIGGMCELMRRIMVLVDDQFGEQAQNHDRVLEMLKGFHDYFEEAIEVIGINAPLDVRQVGPILGSYEKALAALRAWIAHPGGDGAAVVRNVRRDGLGALFELVPLLQNRKRGYLYVNELTVRFTRLLDLFDAKPAPEALKKGFEEHDAALAEFKKFAGLK
jgi:hypothetical protein